MFHNTNATGQLFQIDSLFINIYFMVKDLYINHDQQLRKRTQRQSNLSD